MATRCSGQAAYRKQPTEKQYSAETEEIKKAKQERIFYRLHVENEAEDYGVRARRLID